MTDINTEIKKQLDDKKLAAKRISDRNRVTELIQKNAEAILLGAKIIDDKVFKAKKEEYLTKVIPNMQLDTINEIKKLVGLDLLTQKRILNSIVEEKELQIERNKVCLEVLKEEIEKIGGNNNDNN